MAVCCPAALVLCCGKTMFLLHLPVNREAGVPKGAGRASSFLRRDDLKARTTHAALWPVVLVSPAGKAYPFNQNGTHWVYG